MTPSLKKIFILAGEASGDRLAAWYVRTRLKNISSCHIEAVGGDRLKAEGIKLYERLEKLNIVGIIEDFFSIPRVIAFGYRLAKYITAQGFDEVVLVDFPGFNLPLAKKLKKLNPELKITYVSPPQIWVWGSWRVKKIKKYCDDVIVIYPFEVAWYAKHDVKVTWHGYPFFDDIARHRLSIEERGGAIALVVGSRKSELRSLLPIYAEVMRKMLMRKPNARFVIPLASTVTEKDVALGLRKNGLEVRGKHVRFVSGEAEKFKALASCAVAITKPGTITLELALLGIPAIIIYKVSWITYFLAKLVVNVSHMGLPNLFAKKELYPELLQGRCNPNEISRRALSTLDAFEKRHPAYRKQVAALETISVMLEGPRRSELETRESDL